VFSISGQSRLEAAAAAASPSLSTNTNLNNTITQSGEQKNVAVSGSTVYVVWVDNTLPHTEIFFKKSTNGGSTFGSTINLSNSPGDSFDPQIAISGSTVYVVWDDNTPGASDILIKRSINSGSTFGSTFNLSNNVGNSFNPQIAVSGSTVYIVWEDGTPGNTDIFFRKSNTGTINLSNNVGNSFNPQIAVSGSTVYVVWDDYTPGNRDIFFRKSNTGGSTFGNTINLSTNIGGSSVPQIAVSGSTVYVVWMDYTPGNNDIFFRKSNTGGSTFGNTINLSNDVGLSFTPQIAVASGSTVYVVWHEFPPVLFATSDIFIKRSINSGSTFGSTFNLSNDVGDSFLPHIAVAGSTVYVVWEDGTPGNFDIFFRKSNAGRINLSNDVGNSFNPQIAVP
jgi:hypothetical protein